MFTHDFMYLTANYHKLFLIIILIFTNLCLFMLNLTLVFNFRTKDDYSSHYICSDMPKSLEFILDPREKVY